MKKITVAALLLAFAFGAVSAGSANAQTNPTVQDLLNKIAELQKQIVALQTQKAAVTQELFTTLKQGDQGELVEQLQAFLAAEGFFKHPKITGYFGPVTAQSVKDFQKAHGVSAVGKVGPQTMAKIKEIAAADSASADVAIESDNGGKKACLPPGHLIAPGQQKKGVPNLPSCKNPLPPGIAKLLGQGGPGGGGTGTSTPDTIPPVISNVTATSTTAASTHITWSTNELSDSKVWYATTSPVSTAGTPSVSSSVFVLFHDLLLSNLTASTTYYYRVGSTDQSGNTATSSTDYTFTTLP